MWLPSHMLEKSLVPAWSDRKPADQINFPVMNFRCLNFVAGEITPPPHPQGRHSGAGRWSVQLEHTHSFFEAL